jgi:hypothetical protein
LNTAVATKICEFVTLLLGYNEEMGKDLEEWKEEEEKHGGVQVKTK